MTTTGRRHVSNNNLVVAEGWDRWCWRRTTRCRPARSSANRSRIPKRAFPGTGNEVTEPLSPIRSIAADAEVGLTPTHRSPSGPEIMLDVAPRQGHNRLNRHVTAAGVPRDLRRSTTGCVSAPAAIFRDRRRSDFNEERNHPIVVPPCLIDPGWWLHQPSLIARASKMYKGKIAPRQVRGKSQRSTSY